jgi:hypothetical protein
MGLQLSGQFNATQTQLHLLHLPTDSLTCAVDYQFLISRQGKELQFLILVQSAALQFNGVN